MNGRALDVECELAKLNNIAVLQRPYVNAAYVTGSLLTGMGTPTSDLDVIVLVGSPSDKDLARRDGAQRRHGTVRADIEVFTVGEFADIIGSCADYRVAWETGRIYHIAPAVRTLSQFTAAMQVLKESAELTDFSRRIAAQRAALVEISVMRASIYGNNAHEDLLGFVADKDEIGMLRRSHGYLEFGLDAWCTARGAIYPDDRFKWLWRRLNRVLSSEQELAALRTVYVPETAAVPAASVALRRTDTTQALLAQALLVVWARNQQAWTVPVLPRWDSRDGAGGSGSALWRSSDWMLTRTPDAWGLGAGFLFYEMPVPAVIAWACASGRTDAELEIIVTGHCRAAFGRDIPLAEARAAISRLVKCGAIRREGTPPVSVAKQPG